MTEKPAAVNPKGTFGYELRVQLSSKFVTLIYFWVYSKLELQRW